MSGWGVIRGRWSASPPLPFCTLAPAPRDGGFTCCFCAFLACVVTSAIHTTALPCQQDKTEVVKQSKQSPLTAATSLWCDLQTGFLLPSLAILRQARETHSALPDKKLDQKREKKEHLKWMLSLHIQETAILSSSSEQENHWTDLRGIFSHSGWQKGNQLGTKELHYSPVSPLAAVSDVLSCVLAWHRPRIYHFPIFCCLYFWLRWRAPGSSFRAGRDEREEIKERDKRSDLAIKGRVDKWLRLFNISVSLYVCVPVCDTLL